MQLWADRILKMKFVLYWVIDTVLAPVLRVPHGLRHLPQADFKRSESPKVPVRKMLQNISVSALVAAAESSINYKRDDTVARDASTPSRTSPDGGLTWAV